MSLRLLIVTCKLSVMMMNLSHAAHIYLMKTDLHNPPKMSNHMHAHIHTHSVCSYFLFPSCEEVLRPCILMALMVLHADLRSLKVNFLTSVVFKPRTVIDGPADK